MSSSRLLMLPFLLALASCGDDEADPRPQWLVVVSTDAVVPLMGDRLLVALLDANGNLACPSCRREAVVAPADRWPVSFGIASPSATNEVYVRVRLYRGDRLGSDGQPRAETTIDYLGALPDLTSGVNEVGVHLVVDCLGLEVLGAETCTPGSAPLRETAPTLGPPQDHGRCGGVGMTHFMPSMQERACPAVTEPDMACIPGGLFFMGDALAPVPAKDVLAVTYPERLVAIGSFLMDRYEVTAQQYYQYLVERDGAPPSSCPTGVDCQDIGGSATSKARYCTFPSPMDPPPMDDRAMNCVSWAAARDYCAFYGKRLPSEAEWEYVASNGSRETRYPWGDTPARCDSAYVARGETLFRDDTACLELDGFAGPAPSRDGSWQLSGIVSDETSGEPFAPGACDDPESAGIWPNPSSDHTVRALAGNLSEWTLDLFEPYGSADGEPNCWATTNGPVLDLVHRTQPATCPPPDPVSSLDSLSVRGGSWRDPVDATWSASRSSAPNEPPTPRPEIGFRCVKDLR